MTNLAPNRLSIKESPKDLSTEGRSALMRFRAFLQHIPGIGARGYTHGVEPFDGVRGYLLDLHVNLVGSSGHFGPSFPRDRYGPAVEQ